MRIAVLGGGAIGCLFATLLHKGGHDVTIVARGDNLKRVKNEGLTFRTDLGEEKVRLKAVAKTSEISEADIAIVTVKSYDTEAILKDTAHLGNGTIFFSLQNALNKEEVLCSYVGNKNVIGAVTIEGATMLQPGIIEYTSKNMTWIGDYPNGLFPRTRMIAEVFTGCGLRTEAISNIKQLKWTKFVNYCAIAATSTLTRLYIYQVYKNARTASVWLSLLKEGIQVMLADGVELEDYPFLPIKTYYTLDEKECLEELRKRGEEHERKGIKTQISMLQDVLLGRKTEVEETIGHLVTRAREMKIELPAFNLVYALLTASQSSLSN